MGRQLGCLGPLVAASVGSLCSGTANSSLTGHPHSLKSCKVRTSRHLLPSRLYSGRPSLRVEAAFLLHCPLKPWFSLDWGNCLSSLAKLPVLRQCPLHSSLSTLNPIDHSPAPNTHRLSVPCGYLFIGVHFDSCSSQNLILYLSLPTSISTRQSSNMS